MDYKTKAVNCLKNTALPVLLQRFRECGSDLDAYCAQYGETEFFFARVVQRGHVYEMGYPRCLCPEAPVGRETASFCECSRQGVLYILNTMMPEKHIQAEVIETVLGGGPQCRFRVTVEP